ncbi:MAG: CehA/McbA family metallohydrolase [Bacillota bacterium]
MISGSRLAAKRSTLITIFLVFLLVLALLSWNFAGLGFSQAALAKGNEGGTDLKLKAGRHNGLVVIAPSLVETFKVPPQTITIPIFIAAEGWKGHVKHIKVDYQGPKGVISKTVPVDKAVDSVGMDFDHVMKTLQGRDYGAVKYLLKKGVYTEIEVDVSSLALEAGSLGKMTVGVEGTVDGRKAQVVVEADYQALALPGASGWYGGDGHVHTSWSPDVWFISLDSRVKYAKDNGFGFIIITDHEDGINDLWSTSNGYVAQCNAAQSKYLIPALPGVEISTAESKGHALAYWMSETATNVPNNETYLPQELINRINAHNYPYSYAVIAHPYGAHPWTDWNVTGFRAMELLCQETVAKADTISRWFTILRSGLSSTLSSGRFVVGVGNSDCHNFQAPGFKGFTWVYVTSYSATDRTAIWDAIRSGRVSASGLKDLGYFTVNSSIQGSVIRVSPGQSLKFTMVQKPITGRKCTRITVFNKDQVVVYSVTNPTSSEVYWTTVAPSADTFYVVKFEFTNTDGSNPSEVWANPVFVDVT